MPETPSSDDQFADLFSKLPTPGQRATADAPPTGRAEPTPPEGDASRRTDGTAPASRRAAREAARRAGSSKPVTTVADPSPAAAPRAEQPLDALFGDEDDTLEKARTQRHERDRRKSRIAGWVVFGVIIAILGGIGAGAFHVWNTYEDQIRSFMGWEEPADFEAGMAEGEATISIVSGDTGSSISETLYEAGVTKTPDAFYDYLISTVQDPPFQPGVYTLKKKMTSAAALEALLDPANKRENTAQLPEGLTVDQTLPRLADGIGIPLEEFEAAVADPSAYGVAADSLEGWLFPATYTFDPGVTAQDVIGTLVDRTVQSLDAAEVPADRRQEILTIASIIQREGRTQDFDKVSRVIQNRLSPENQETFGKLEMDSTAQYGYGEMHDGTASSSQEALDDDNPWNTYVHTGLPAGPISNPGDAAIDAAMHPAEGPWLYFVTWNMDTGETIFSATYAEHLEGVAKWDQWCAENDNRDC